MMLDVITNYRCWSRDALNNHPSSAHDACKVRSTANCPEALHCTVLLLLAWACLVLSVLCFTLS